MNERVLDMYSFASHLADHIYNDIRDTTDDDKVESVRTLRFTILNGIAAFEDLEDEEGRTYRVEINRTEEAT